MTIVSTENPIKLFQSWYAEAQDAEPRDQTAVALATVGSDGMPSVRMVLLKDVDDDGFVFYTNFESRKGVEILATPKAALCFHWKSLKRQVRVEGEVSVVSDEEADAYFASRARGSQIGAWASLQSSPLSGNAELLKRVGQFTATFGLGKVPRPPHWSGFRIAPRAIEFWKDGKFRLHERLNYTRADDGWKKETLYP